MAQATARVVYEVLGYVNVSTVLLGLIVEIISIFGSPKSYISPSPNDRILGVSWRSTNQDMVKVKFSLLI
jgi:hypothetical protein